MLIASKVSPDCPSENVSWAKLYLPSQSLAKALLKALKPVSGMTGSPVCRLDASSLPSFSCH